MKKELMRDREQDQNQDQKQVSVLMSVYCRENPGWFARALRSITLEQTRRPDELVLVADGPLTEELEKEILRFIE